jgi:type I restriction enzyme S subunit
VQDATFEKMKIGDLGRIVTGRTPPSSKPECFGDKYPFITPGDMHDRKNASTTERYLSEEGAELLKRNLLPPGSIAVSCIGWQMGKAIKVTRPSFSNQQLNTIIPNESVDSDYLYYLMVTKRQELFSLGSATGVRTPILNKSAFSNIDVLIPGIKKQMEVAEILSAYDNLIENNNRRIAILEEMAQSLYREWFVKFRFPGHENAKFIDSPLGKIPEGWEVKKLKEVASINPESISAKTAPENIRYIDISSVGTGVIDEIKFMPFSEAPSRARRVVRDGDIIWATVRPNRKQYSYIAKPEGNTVVSTGFAVIRAKTAPQSYLMQVVSTDGFVSYLVNHATGAAYPAVNAKDFEDADILVPSDNILDMFDGISSAVIEQCEMLKRKNRNLVDQRELLLPKLISGAISLGVSDVRECAG